jgi:hypothetical protein
MSSVQRFCSWGIAGFLFAMPLLIAYAFPHHDRLVSGLGLLGLSALAWSLSSRREIVPWRVVIGGLRYSWRSVS